MVYIYFADLQLFQVVPIITYLGILESKDWHRILENIIYNIC